MIKLFIVRPKRTYYAADYIRFLKKCLANSR